MCVHETLVSESTVAVTFLNYGRGWPCADGGSDTEQGLCHRESRLEVEM